MNAKSANFASLPSETVEARVIKLFCAYHWFEPVKLATAAVAFCCQEVQAGMH